MTGRQIDIRNAMTVGEAIAALRALGDDTLRLAASDLSQVLERIEISELDAEDAELVGNTRFASMVFDFWPDFPDTPKGRLDDGLVTRERPRKEAEREEKR